MKKIIACLLLLMTCTAGYSAEYMHTRSRDGQVIRIQNVNRTYSKCQSYFMDDAYWVYYAMDGNSYVLYYTNDNACREDFKIFTKKVALHDYNVCVQYGGGKACEHRK